MHYTEAQRKKKTKKKMNAHCDSAAHTMCLMEFLLARIGCFLPHNNFIFPFSFFSDVTQAAAAAMKNDNDAEL